jgi:hypothetical protein
MIGDFDGLKSFDKLRMIGDFGGLSRWPLEAVSGARWRGHSFGHRCERRRLATVPATPSPASSRA